MSKVKPKFKKAYRQLAFKDDPRTMLQIPVEVMGDLKLMAEFNQRSLRAEIIARLVASLTHNEYMMTHDRLHQLIFNTKLAVREKKRKKKSIKK